MYKSKSIITLTLVAIMMFIALISNYIIINYQYFRINNLSKKLFSNTNNYNELSRKNKNLEYNIIYYDKLYQDLQEKSHEAENRLQELEDLQNEIINRLSLSIDNNIIEQRHLDSSPTTSLTELNNKIIKNILNYKALLNDFSNEKLTPSIKPAQGIISSLVGFRPNPITNHTEYHTGLDIAASIGTQVVATASGEVTFADYRNG